MAAWLARILSINGAQATVSVFKYKTLIANVLVRIPVCKTDNFPGSQGKMCRVGFLQLLITNVLDGTLICKVRAMVFPLKSRENSQRRICASLQCKRLFWMTCVQPRTNNLLRFSSVILSMLPFVKLERLTFVDLVTLPFFNLVTLRFVKI